MLFDPHSLLAYSTLTNSPGTAGTSFTVQPGEGGRFAQGQQLTYWPANVIPHKGNAETGRLTTLSTTTIAAASKGVALPTGTITVASTTGFPASGTITVVTSNGDQAVTFTGTTATTFTGCTGGTGTMSNGGAVTSDTFTVTRTQEGANNQNVESGWQIANTCAGSRRHPRRGVAVQGGQDARR